MNSDIKNYTATGPRPRLSNQAVRAAIWIGFWLAGCAMIGLFGGIAWGFIMPLIAELLS